MNFNLVVNQILILFIIILVGYILRKNEIINKEIDKGLTNLLMEITLPALIISSFSINIDKTMISNIKIFVILTIIFYLSMIVISIFFTRFIPIRREKKIILEYIIIFANVGYMGIPVINTIYPEIGIFYVVINHMFFNIILWTYGVYLYKRDQDNGHLKIKNMLNNGIIAVFIGLIILIGNISLPVPISGAIDSLGNMTFPLSMLLIGSSLTAVKLKNIWNDWYLILTTSMRLLIIPFSFFLIFHFFALPDPTKNITVLLAAMPAGACSVVFAEKYDGDYKFASEGVFITTLFSLFTIPFIIWVISI